MSTSRSSTCAGTGWKRADRPPRGHRRELCEEPMRSIAQCDFRRAGALPGGKVACWPERLSPGMPELRAGVRTCGARPRRRRPPAPTGCPTGRAPSTCSTRGSPQRPDVTNWSSDSAIAGRNCARIAQCFPAIGAGNRVRFAPSPSAKPAIRQRAGNRRGRAIGPRAILLRRSFTFWSRRARHCPRASSALARQIGGAGAISCQINRLASVAQPLR